MARKCRHAFRQVPKPTLAALSKTARLSNDKAYLKMGEMKVPIVTPHKRVSQLAKRAVRRNNVSVHISSFPRKHSRADGLATRSWEWDADGVRYNEKVYLHPILKYYPEKYVKDVIDHELDHVKVDRKTFINWLRKYWKMD
jgi:hypothetical protein